MTLNCTCNRTNGRHHNGCEGIGKPRRARGGGSRLSVGGTSREVGQWVDRSGWVYHDPHSEGAPFIPESDEQEKN